MFIVAVFVTTKKKKKKIETQASITESINKKVIIKTKTSLSHKKEINH